MRQGEVSVSIVPYLFIVHCLKIGLMKWNMCFLDIQVICCLSNRLPINSETLSYVPFQNREAKLLHTLAENIENLVVLTYRWVWSLCALWLSLSMCICAFVWKSISMWFPALVGIIINPLQNISWYLYSGTP